MSMTMSPPSRRQAISHEPTLRESAGADSSIPVAFKSPMSPRALTASLDRRLTLNQAVRELRKLPPTDTADHRLVLQLEREMSGPHDFLALGLTGELTKVDPDTTTLSDISVPREVRTARGVETTPIAGCEIQAYAPVG
jgi:hypothetical protein